MTKEERLHTLSNILDETFDLIVECDDEEVISEARKTFSDAMSAWLAIALGGV